MDLRPKLLWIDCTAGFVAGITVLTLHWWFAAFYELPRCLLLFNAIMNCVYASCSCSLAARSNRPLMLIGLLAAANLVWAVFCVGIVVAYYGTANIFGLAHFGLEAFFVGGLGFIEWRYRDWLLTRSDPSGAIP